MNKKCQIFTPDGYVKKTIGLYTVLRKYIRQEHIGEFMWRWEYFGCNCRTIY